jgi:cytochrome c2
MYYKRLIITLFVVISLTTLAIAQSLPEGENGEKVRKICSLCHGFEVVKAQRLSKSEWTSVVERMIGWGAPIKTEEDKEAIINYLASHFGEKEK